jgi:UDP-N-acetylglucosamine 2-epimerase (non-hydrolysing)
VIYVILGTKAQLIKMAPIMHLLQERSVPYRFIFTGQHQETMDALRENFSIKSPDILLHTGKDIVSIPSMIKWMFAILGKVFLNRKKIFPQKSGIVLVHGDTFSTLLGAWMGKCAGLKVAHVESGLRSFHLFHPFPEELTRLATFCLSDQYFCPGVWAVQNLSAYRGKKIDTGYNTLLDGLAYVKKVSIESLDLEIPRAPFCIVSLHRFENVATKSLLQQNLALIERVAAHTLTLFILHPITREKLQAYGLIDVLEKNPRIQLRPRYDFVRFIKLLEASEFLVTDGGSNQEECTYMGKPCLLLRKATERQEGIGENVVISRYEMAVVEEFLNHYTRYQRPPVYAPISPSAMIVDSIAAYA